MNVQNIVNDLETALADTGYSLYFGSRAMYNTVKQTPDKVVIVEPFPVYPARDGACYYDTQFTLWVGIRRSVDAKFHDAKGKQAVLMDELLTDATAVVNAIRQHIRIRLNQNMEAIEMRYYEADSGATVMSQAFLTFTIPVTIWLLSE